MKRVPQVVVGALLGATMLSGGVAAASAYPPDATTPTTVVTVTTPTTQATDDPQGALPATGSDNGPMVAIAGAAIVAGVCIVGATKVRRRSSSN